MAKKAGDSSNSASGGSPQRSVPVEKTLNENFVALQQVMTNLAVSLDQLSGRISKLLDLFEMSAKSLAEKDFGKEPNAEINQKLNSLLDQNKILAKGISLLHETGFQEQQPVEMPAERFMPAQIQPQRPRNPPQMKRVETDGYQKSISSGP